MYYLLTILALVLNFDVHTFYTRIMVRTVSISSTISTQPASKFLLTVQIAKSTSRASYISMPDIPDTKIIIKYQP